MLIGKAVIAEGLPKGESEGDGKKLEGVLPHINFGKTPRNSRVV